LDAVRHEGNNIQLKGRNAIKDDALASYDLVSGKTSWKVGINAQFVLDMILNGREEYLRRRNEDAAVRYAAMQYLKAAAAVFEAQGRRYGARYNPWDYLPVGTPTAVEIINRCGHTG